MSSIYTPGEGFFAGIYAFTQGEQPKDNTFLQNIAKKTPPWYATEIEFAIDKGKVFVAEEVGYGGDSNFVNEDKFKREVYTFPLFSEYIRITGSDLQKRPPTKHPNERWSSEEAQAFWVERKVSDLYSRILRGRERMMSQLILDGKIVFSVTQDIDLKRAKDLEKKLNGTNPKWDDATSKHDPIKDIADMCFQVHKETGIRPKGILMDGITYEQMRRSPQFLHMASVTFSDMNLGTKTNQENGAVVMGTLMAGGCHLDVWIYDGGYRDKDGKFKQFIPTGKVVIGDFSSQNPRIKWYFGATDALQSHIDLAKSLGLKTSDILGDIAGGSVVPTHWVDRNCLEVGLQCAMVCLPSDINMFGVLTVT